MAYMHSRSNTLPSKLNTVIDNVHDHLCRLKSSEATSISAASVLKNLNCIRALQEGIINMIQMPSIHQIISHKQYESWRNEILEGSLGIVDLCGFSRDVVYSTKESVQELKSAIRRNRGETLVSEDLNAYESSRNKINKRVNKCIKNLKSFKTNPTEIPDMDSDIKAVTTMLKETEALGFSVLKSGLMIVSGAKGRSNQRNWLLLSKFTQQNGEEDLCSLKIKKLLKRKHDFDVLKQLKQSEMIIEELEEGLEALFRSSVKTRVSLLNILSH